MAKYSGNIGFIDSVDTSPGIWEQQIVAVRKYTGDVIHVSRRSAGDDQVNENVRLSNVIKIVADAYANNNFQFIAYVEWRGVKWKITDVEVSRPRLILTLGGVYSGI
jgi:hypothetical protein